MFISCIIGMFLCYCFSYLFFSLKGTHWKNSKNEKRKNSATADCQDFHSHKSFFKIVLFFRGSLACLVFEKYFWCRTCWVQKWFLDSLVIWYIIFSKTECWDRKIVLTQWYICLRSRFTSESKAIFPTENNQKYFSKAWHAKFPQKAILPTSSSDLRALVIKNLCTREYK